MKEALLVLDIINELVHKDGEVGKDGFYENASQKGTVPNTARMIQNCRNRGVPVIYIVIGFSEDFREWSEKTKLFRHVKDKKQVILGSWSTQIDERLSPMPGESIIIKHRVDPFYGTNLDQLLSTMGIEHLILTGVSTDFVVLSTTMSAHDRDYNITVLEDCVSSSDHQSDSAALHIINKLAEVTTTAKFLKDFGVNHAAIV